MKFQIAVLLFCMAIVSVNSNTIASSYGALNGSSSTEAANDTDTIDLYYTTIPTYLTHDTVDSLPYIVGLRESTKGRSYCAGALVHARWVLTTIDCAPTKSGFLGIGWYYKDQYALIGSMLAKGAYDSDEQIKIINRFPHPDYNKKTRENDYMMLKLKTDSRHTPVTRAQDGEHYFEYPTTGFVFGWQSTTDPKVEMWTSLLNTTVQWAANCTKTVDKVFASQFCAIGTELNNPCRYSNGSPIIVRFPTYDYLVGMVSYNPGCGKDSTPTLFARECKAQQWVTDIIHSYP